MRNEITVQFTGSYQIAGSRCLCSQDRPITPWLSGSCGFGNEPQRRVQVAIGSELHFLPSYQLRTSSVVRQVQALDRCHVSVFASDVTQLVVDSIRSSLLAFCSSLDTTLSGMAFTGVQNLIRERSFRKSALGKFGYLVLNPLEIRLSPLDLIKDSFEISAGVTCRPALTSDSSNSATALPGLPPLVQTSHSSGIALYLNADYDYVFISSLLHDSLYNKVFDIKGRVVVVKDARVKSIGNHQLEVQIDFTGTNRGSIYIRGTPTLDTMKQTLSVPDISYSLESQDLALKIARSLFHNRIRKSLQGETYLDIAALVKTSLPNFNQQLSQRLTAGFCSNAEVKELRLIGFMAGTTALKAQVLIRGNLSISGGGNF